MHAALGMGAPDLMLPDSLVNAQLPGIDTLASFLIFRPVI